MVEFKSGVDHLLETSIDIGGVQLPDSVANVDGMIDKRERQMIFRLARDHYIGEGAIIDGGMLLGASGVALAEGLRASPRCADIMARPREGKIITGYEIGVLPANGPQARVVKAGRAEITMGQSFAPILAATMAPYADLVDIQLGDLLEAAWDPTRPIEILFIDVAKTPRLNQHIFTTFFPALIPGRSLVLQQDYFFDRLPWIKILMGHLADHFEWLGQVGCTAVFRYTRAIPREMYAIDPYRDLPGARRIALHRLAEDERLPPRRQFALAVSLAYLIFEVEGEAAANRHLDAVTERFATFITAPAAGLPVSERIARARRFMQAKRRT